MKTHIQKWGNSLALRIPKSFAAETHLEQGTLVEVSLVNGTLHVMPLRQPAVTLEELLQGVTPRTCITKSTRGQPWGVKCGSHPSRVCA